MNSQESMAWWDATLSELENTVRQTRDQLATRAEVLESDTAWQAPLPAAPMPAELVSRARALLDAQEELRKALDSARQQSRAQQVVTHRFSSGMAAPSVYVDVSA